MPRSAILSLSALFCLCAPLLAQVNQSFVYLYKDSVYRGSMMPISLAIFAPNTPFTVPGGFEDEVTSLRWQLTPGTRLTFFHDKEGKGAQYRISASTSRNSGDSNVGSLHNDKFSSFMWEYEDSSTGGSITMFEDSSYGGRSHVIPLSSYTPGNRYRLWGADDKVTSMRWSLRNNVAITFYEHRDGSGREYTIMHDAGRTSGVLNLGGYYNDKFSSFSWRVVDPSKGWVRFYTDKFFAGYHLTRYFGNTGNWSLKPEGYNDQVDSIKWSLPANRSLVAYHDDNLQGAGLSMVNSGQRDRLSWHNDRLTSYALYSGQLGSDLADRNLPLNEICMLAANEAAGSPDRGFLNTQQQGCWQKLDIDEMLDHGVRALHLKCQEQAGRMYSIVFNHNETVRLRSSGSPELLVGVLSDIRRWLDDNPDEVVVLYMPKYGANDDALSQLLFTTFFLKDWIYEHRTGTWPSINQLVAMRKRIVVLSGSNESGGRLSKDRDEMCQNAVGHLDTTSVAAGSAPINRLARGLFWMNRAYGSTITSRDPGNTSQKLLALAARFTQPCNFICIDDVAKGNQGLHATRARNLLMRRARSKNGIQAYAYGFGLENGGLFDLVLSAGSPPILGQNLRLDFSRTFGGILVAGLSDRSSSLGALPQPLWFGQGDTLRVAPTLLVGLPSVQSLNFGLPNQASLRGLDVYMQGVYGNGQTTSGLRLKLGVR